MKSATQQFREARRAGRPNLGPARKGGVSLGTDRAPQVRHSAALLPNHVIENRSTLAAKGCLYS